MDENFYGEGDAYYYFIFPNIMVNILPGRLQVNLILPVESEKTLVLFDYYYDDITSQKAVNKIEEDLRYSDEIRREDIFICEKVQKGLKSDAYDKGRLSVECERGVYHFQSLRKETFRKNLELK